MCIRDRSPLISVQPTRIDGAATSDLRQTGEHGRMIVQHLDTFKAHVQFLGLPPELDIDIEQNLNMLTYKPDRANQHVPLALVVQLLDHLARIGAEPRVGSLSLIHISEPTR